MKIEKFKTIGVAKTGIVKGGGAVITEGDIRILRGEGCGSKGCHCSDGYSISIIMPRTKQGVVEGIQARFDSLEEMKTKLEF